MTALTALLTPLTARRRSRSMPTSGKRHLPLWPLSVLFRAAEAVKAVKAESRFFRQGTVLSETIQPL